MKNTLIKYLNDNTGNRRGCITCTGRKVPGQESGDSRSFLIGASFCNRNDVFKKKVGRDIAIGRAEKGVPCNIPGDMITTTSVAWEQMVARAEKYFK